MNKKPPKSFSFEDVKKYLPSRGVFFIILGTSCTLLMAYLFAGLVTTKYSSKSLSVKTVGGAIGKDADGDGVPDWEESLWGTDPRVPDTDGDGTPDGTEISLQKNQLAIENGYGTSTVFLSETDKFSRDLFVTYSALSAQGQLSSDAATKLGNAAIAKSFDNVPTVPTYSKVDIKIVPATGASDLEYRKNISKLSSIDGVTVGAEFPLINTGILTEDVGRLRMASKYSKTYTQYITSLLKIPVPSNQAENHIRLLNDLSYISIVLPQITALENDVIKGYPLYTIYVKAYKDMFGAFENIGNQRI